MITEGELGHADELNESDAPLPSPSPAPGLSPSSSPHRRAPRSSTGMPTPAPIRPSRSTAATLSAPAPFGEPNNIAINQATGDVYVGGSSGYVYHLNAQGVSQPFSAVAPSTVLSQRTYGLGALKVDNSGTSTQGRIYAKEEYSALAAATCPRGPRSALDSQSKTSVTGVVWTSHRTAGSGSRTTATGPIATAPPESNSNEMIAFGGMCGFAIDSDENFYIPGYGGGTHPEVSAARAPFSTNTGVEKGRAAKTSRSTAPRDTVFAARGNSVNVIDSDGDLIDTFGFAEGGKSYPGLGQRRWHRGQRDDPRGLRRQREHRQGRPVRPDRAGHDPRTPRPNRPTVTPTTATLKASVDPDAANSGTPITNCQFEWGSTTEYDHVVACDQATPIGAPTECDGDHHRTHSGRHLPLPDHGGQCQRSPGKWSGSELPALGPAGDQQRSRPLKSSRTALG